MINASLTPIDSIQPSPENDSIYGAIDPSNIDLINLARDIATSGVREPLQVCRDGYIVSGHRRYAAAKLAGLDQLPVVKLNLRRLEHSSSEWMRLLRAHNHQRVKLAHVRIKEALLDIDPDLAHEQLIAAREERASTSPPSIVIDGEKVRCLISDRKQQMLDRVLEVVGELKEFWPVSVRQIHYGLLNAPPLRNSSKGKQRSLYENDIKSYNDLCDLVTRARLIGLIPWHAVADETRPVSGIRNSQDLAQFVDLETHNFLRGYRRNLLQSQADHVELVVEKLTVQGIIEPVAKRYTMPMTVGRGYCSIQPRYEIVQRYMQSGKDRLVLLIASDFDPDGEEIAESFVKSIRDDFNVSEVRASKILLRRDQIEDWGLPANQLEAKESSSKFTKFVERYGSRAVYELEAVQPSQMQQAVIDAIESTIDLRAFNAELGQEKRDAAQLQAMKQTMVKAFSGLLGNGEAGQ